LKATPGRREFLKLSAGMLAGICAGNLAGCGSENSPEAASSDAIALQFSFWGSAIRADLTTEVIQLYQQRYPHTTISSWFTGFGQY
jgi:ABC-type phosphate transport system substrate-binding protein